MHILVYKLKNTLLGKLFGFLLLFAIFVPLLTHYYLGKETAKDGFAPMPFHTRTKLDSIDSAGLKYEELQKEIGELNKIKISLNNELRELEGRRTQLQLEIQTYNERASAAKSKAEKVKADVGRAHRELEVIRLAKIEANDCPQLPYLRPPHRLQIVSAEQNDVDALTHTKLNSHLCQLSRCFDFSRCSLNSGFPVYIYDPAVYMIGKSPLKLNLLRIAALLKKLPYIVTDGTKACLYVVLVGSFEDNEAKSIESALQILPYWDKNGRNHLVLQLRNGTTSTEISSLDINYGFAMLAQSSFHGTRRYRHKFDMSVMPISSQESGEVWHTATFQLPAVRKYFLSFEGELSNSSSSNGITVIDLKELAAEASDFYVKTACPKQNGSFHTHDHIWTLCGDITYRATLLSQSTYTLVVGLNDKSALWDTVHIRLVEALQHGAVPVILADDVVLPFNDVINWKETAIILPMARVTEINFVLRTITNEDLLNMRWQGRFLWETYFSTTEAILHTVLATVRTRLSLPAPPLPGVASESVFDAENPPMKGALDPDAVLEIRRSSPSYYRNFTSTTVDSSHIWNSAPGALWMFPSTPFDPVLPSSAPFMHSAKGFDLIGNGEGGAGAEFSKALGGNVAKEQFTIVMLTYERELVLIEALQRLVGLQYLNKVVVVWNSPNAPLPSLQWPDIGVPIEVVKSGKNSLNNRFIPYDVIETDCILSIDDDAHLRQDEMQLGFRVWREARDRIVGFPGRYHAWDTRHGGWLYNANHTCELSMVLTGAAFFHRYYSYLYTYWMSQAIRDKVDELMNCEDIAMNFLVSHITRKPPLKVTSRWTFSCPGCPVALHQDESHFIERHDCINYFEKVYGYMPLLRTQFRVDSVLFKTRIPSSKTKCFKYV